MVSACPSVEGVEGLLQAEAFLGEPVFDTGRDDRMGGACHHAVGLQGAQLLDQHFLCYGRNKLLEFGKPQGGVPEELVDDHQFPASLKYPKAGLNVIDHAGRVVR